MNTYLWVMLILLSLSIFGKLYMLATGEFDKRTPKGEALDVLINGIVIIWTAVLLFGV